MFNVLVLLTKKNEKKLYNFDSWGEALKEARDARSSNRFSAGCALSSSGRLWRFGKVINTAKYKVETEVVEKETEEINVKGIDESSDIIDSVNIDDIEES